MTEERLARGKKGEEAATQELLRRGYRILARNFRCPLGEIDIIGTKGKQLVFVEVKAGTSLTFGLPQERVNHRKQEKIKRVAQYYLQGTGQWQGETAFFVVAVFMDKGGKVTETVVIEDAF